MSHCLELSDDLVAGIKIPRRQLHQRLKQELAFALYAQDLASFGIARRYASLGKEEFLRGLAERGIERHYYATELEEDLAYAWRGQTRIKR